MIFIQSLCNHFEEFYVFPTILIYAYRRSFSALANIFISNFIVIKLTITLLSILSQCIHFLCVVYEVNIGINTVHCLHKYAVNHIDIVNTSLCVVYNNNIIFSVELLKWIYKYIYISNSFWDTRLTKICLSKKYLKLLMFE